MSAAYTALLESETKESLARMVVDLREQVAALKRSGSGGARRPPQLIPVDKPARCRDCQEPIAFCESTKNPGKKYPTDVNTGEIDGERRLVTSKGWFHKCSARGGQ